MSRDKFEAWMQTIPKEYWPPTAEMAFKAGRESMQDEAALEAEQGIWMCKTSEEIIDSIGKAIREIEL